MVSRSPCAEQSGSRLQISLVAQAEHATPILPAHGTELGLRAIHCKSSREFGLNGGMSKSPFMSVQKRCNMLVLRELTFCDNYESRHESRASGRGTSFTLTALTGEHLQLIM